MSRFACRIALTTVAAGLLVALTASPASAQQPPSQPPPNGALPPPQPPPASARAPNGEYVAPMQQQTQQIYVPQSVAMSGPRVIKDYEEGDPIPPGYHADTQMRKGLVIGGAITFGCMYIFSVIAGAAIDDTNKDYKYVNGNYTTTKGSAEDSGTFLYIPVAGPFLQMTRTETATGNVFLAIDGIAQAAGATMLIVGLTSPKTVLIRNDLAEVKVTPMRMGMDGSGTGLGLVGTF